MWVKLLEEELRLVFDAEQAAKKILAKAERNVRRIESETKSEADALIRRFRDDAQKRGQELISQRVAEAENKGKELRSIQEVKTAEMNRLATSRMKEAGGLILRSIIEES